MSRLDPSILTGPTAWDLETVFAGGVHGVPFQAALASLSERIEAFERQVEGLPDLADDADAWAEVIGAQPDLINTIGTVMAFAGCTYAAHATLEEARLARERAVRLWDRVIEAKVPLLAGLDAADEPTFEDLVQRPDLAANEPMLRNDRRNRSLRLPREQSVLLEALRPHALGGWGALYTDLSGRLQAEVELPGEGRVQRSMGQLAGLMGSTDAAVRSAAFHASNQAWQGISTTCARALGHITGSRASLNRLRGLDELADTCGQNRITRATLDAMWAATDEAHQPLRAYLERKAQLLGVDRLAFWDLRAPVPGQGDGAVDWADACRWIVEAFSAYDPEMGAFAAAALNQRWVEAEARPGKRQGGFCSRMGTHSQSRIFLTWSGTLTSTLTLAHELGHAWHNEILFRQSPARRGITSATAETASTFGEALFRDHMMSTAADADMRRRMLDQLAMAGVTFLMDIPARYTFERELYRLQAEGPLTAPDLSAAMVQAQQQSFGADTLSGWNDAYWASKLHFYISGFGFYNWPYAFGYLFSSAVYARAQQEGPSFAPQVRRLLAETGYRWTEDVARDVLGADITDPAFWRAATAPLLSAVDAFLDETA